MPVRWRALPIYAIAAATVMAATAHIVARHTLAVVDARRLLPRWDLATHLVHGWVDAHFLATGQIHRLLWDLWLQGYWPPVLSIVQIPFYLFMGGGLTAGLWTNLIAFCLVGVTGTAILHRLWGTAAILPASVFLALLLSSPFLLAYASVTMTEMLGALTQLLVLLAYVHYRHAPGGSTARVFALSLSLLFFTKYNYFLMLAGPLVVHEWLERTTGRSPRQRLAGLWRWTRQVASSRTAVFAAVYITMVLAIVGSGGFELSVLGQPISVRSVGNSGYILLYVLLARLWYLHRRGRVDWASITSSDRRARPLLIWFAAPVTLWMASPYPNHMRDFANLVINRPVGEPSVGGGISTYLDALQSSYFYSPWILAFVLAAFASAAVRYKRHPPLMQWLILAIPMQLVAIASHQTRAPRFLLLTVVLLCLAAAIETGRWCAGSSARRLAAAMLAPVVLAGGVLATRAVVTEERFRTVAFDLYVDSDALRDALGAIRATLGGDDRLAIVGQNNDLSPALFRWELGPPAGAPCFPFELAGARRLDLADATRVLLLENIGPVAQLDPTSYYETQRQAVAEQVHRGAFTLEREFPVTDLGVILRLYRQTTPVGPETACW
jgi:hypothetical protein